MFSFFQIFPDCAVCKCMSDDGGWLDTYNRFWVCIDCDDWLDEIERKKDKGSTLKEKST